MGMVKRLVPQHLLLELCLKALKMLDWEHIFWSPSRKVILTPAVPIPKSGVPVKEWVLNMCTSICVKSVQDPDLHTSSSRCVSRNDLVEWGNRIVYIQSACYVL